ncbi:spermatogenesis-associated protein 1 [Pristis pectinata]|uniref:spermatogenesis-associated protein 1 n=1 Tax=Pristis pectinata TaxID=685728 RepID=UPI00223D1C4B|nr:spermatogenesis-associated protein 1 [Pristis pectinata]
MAELYLNRGSGLDSVLELHVFCVPADLWNSTLNTVSTHAISKFISVGFVRVLPELSLKALRLQIGNLLGADAVDDKFAFLKCVGRSLAVVRTKQELELKVKLFAPPHAPQPELYLLPGMGLVGRRQPSGVLTPGAQQRPKGVSKSYVLHPSLPSEGSESSGGCKSFGCSCQVCVAKELDRDCAYLTEEGPQSSNQEENVAGGVRKAETIQCARTPEIISTSLPLPCRPSSANLENGDLRECKGNDYSREFDRTKSPDVYAAWEQESSLGKDTKQSHPKIARSQQDKHQAQQRTKGSVANVGTGECGLLVFRVDAVMVIDQQVSQGSESRNVGQETSQPPGSSREPDHPLGGKQYSLPPPPPLLTVTVQGSPLPTDKEHLVAQINAVKQERKSLEKAREELVKKAKALLSENRLRRNQARDSWKKRYFESKKATAPLEETSSKLRQELEMFYLKLLHQLAARETRKGFQKAASASGSKNELIIQITTLKHEIDQLYRRLENAKMKLVTEIKLRKQTLTDLRALRAELVQKKTQSSLTRLHTGSTPRSLNIFTS